MRKLWFQISIVASSKNYQDVEQTLLALGAQSVSFKDAADNPILEPRPGETPLWRDAIITGLYDDHADPSFLTQRISELLADQDLDIKIDTLPEQDWTRAWMDSFKPMRFGERLWVCPKHMEPPEPDAINLRLDPGLAFGTGTHPTTSLCLRWLDRYVSHQSGHESVLDYGSGSGILAIAALLLGARHADCVDIDRQALLATRENAVGNRVSDNLATFLPGELPADRQFNLVLANILSGPLIELAPHLARHCHAGSDLVLSGILQSQADAVRHAYSDFFNITSTEVLDDWVLLHGERNG